jgi:hypothetical protein
MHSGACGGFWPQSPPAIPSVVVLVAIWHNPQTLCVNTAIVARATVPA